MRLVETSVSWEQNCWNLPIWRERERERDRGLLHMNLSGGDSLCMMSARKLELTIVTPHSTAFSYFLPLALQTVTTAVETSLY